MWGGLCPARARAVTSATISHLIIRACRSCGHPRQLDTPCQGCGLTDPPQTYDLGVQAATYRNPILRAAWTLFGSRAATRRATRYAREVTRGEHHQIPPRH